MSDSFKETALKLALKYSTGEVLDIDEVLRVATLFERFLAEPDNDQVRIERDEARARVVSLERELSEIASGLTAGVTKRALALVVELSERYEETDRLVIGAAVESAAARMGVTL